MSYQVPCTIWYPHHHDGNLDKLSRRVINYILLIFILHMMLIIEVVGEKRERESDKTIHADRGGEGIATLSYGSSPSSLRNKNTLKGWLRQS